MQLRLMSKPRLILHIGSQKTGTTSIQKFLEINRHYLYEQDIYIPDNLGGMNHRHAVFIAENTDKREDAFTISRGLEGNEEKKRCFKHKVLNTLEAQCKKYKDKLWIVTSEFFQSRLNTDEEVDRLNRILGCLFSEVQIICYVRDPLSTAISTWSTYVMSGGVAQQLPRAGTIFHNNCDHKSFITRWEKNFNYQKIIIRNFSKTCLINKNVIEDFCEQARIKCDKRFIYPENRNSSLTHKGILILSKLNSLTNNLELQQKNAIRKIMSLVVQRNFQEYPMYLPSQAEIIEYHELYFDSFKWVSNRYFDKFISTKESFKSKFREEEDSRFIDSLQASDISFIKCMLDIYKLREKKMSNQIRF
jgi:hypothetical protein|tara:strand:- start:324 stop:1406 length:1083 start_codon:yes stop_codon:yes gene_type:complete